MTPRASWQAFMSHKARARGSWDPGVDACVAALTASYNRESEIALQLGGVTMSLIRAGELEPAEAVS